VLDRIEDQHKIKLMGDQFRCVFDDVGSPAKPLFGDAACMVGWFNAKAFPASFGSQGQVGSISAANIQDGTFPVVRKIVK
jgi:hypothetical protein